MENALAEIANVEFKPMVSDAIAKKLAPKIAGLARLLKKAGEERRFVLLRFHHDADGICAAFALAEILRFQPYQQNGAAYSVKDAMRDLGSVSYEQKPLAVLVDFGLNPQSTEGLSLLKAGGVEIFAIDHHPPSEKALSVVDYFLSPWEFSKDESTSRYVAGYLASEVARAAGATDVEKFAKIACAGDKSALFGEPGKDERDAALVLDYMAAHSGYGNNLRFYRNVLSNKELFASMLQQADEKINEAADKAMCGMKERKSNEAAKEGGVAVFVIDLEKVVRTGEFPNRSKVTTRVFERLKERFSREGEQGVRGPRNRRAHGHHPAEPGSC